MILPFSCSVVLTLCDPMDCSTPGFLVLHHLLELAQTHVHGISDAIQPSHLCLPLLLLPSQHQGLSQWVGSSSRWPKCWSFIFSISPSNEYSGLISYRIDWLDLAVQGTLKSLLQYHSSKASILWLSAFFLLFSSHIFIAKFRLKLKNVGKTTKPFRYDLNQIPYDYTVDVTNRFMGLDLIECLKNYGRRFVTLYRRRWSKSPPTKKKYKKIVWGSLTNSWEKKRHKGKGEKERYTHLNAEFQRIARRDKKAFLREQCKEVEENMEWEKLEIS